VKQNDLRSQVLYNQGQLPFLLYSLLGELKENFFFPLINTTLVKTLHETKVITWWFLHFLFNITAEILGLMFIISYRSSNVKIQIKHILKKE